MQLKLKHELKNCKSFVELGCGVKSPAVEYIRNIRTVGIDGHLPSLWANKDNGYFKDYVLADLMHLPLKYNSFDCVAAFDVIEHLTKPQANQLIEDMEKVSRKKVIISTPNGFNPKCHLEDDNPLQVHTCSWTMDEISNRGYVVFGINGVLRLRGEYASATIKPEILGSLLSRLSDPFVYKFPTAAFHLLCIKTKS
jgi:ubiquinone/menaquinone biosynthesis C-methylase UbiE